MNALLHLGSLPRQTTRGTIVRLLIQVGGLAKDRIGSIELRGREATVEVPTHLLDALVRALDGTRLAHDHIRAWRELGAGEGAEDHFQRLARLMEMEAEAEAQQLLRARQRLAPEDAERTGMTLLHLVVEDSELGLGNRSLLTLVRKDRGDLPWTRLDAGSPVVMTAQVERPRESVRGVISERRRRSVQVAFEDPPDLEDATAYRLDLANDEVARQRQREALQRVAVAHGDRLAELRQLLVEGGTFRTHADPPGFQPLDESLNDSQREAVAFALASRDVAILHGPPGTGKTTAVVELIRQAVRRGERVLACAPSNLGVDNLLERLVRHGERVVRLGHPARVLPQLREHTLDYLADKHPDARLACKLIRQAAQLRDRAGRFTRARPEPGAKQAMRDEARELLEDARRLERQLTQQILDQAQVLCATTTGLDARLLGTRQFDLAVIDEACQTTEPGCWTVVPRCQRLVLAGDHCQLPPTVVSAEAARQGFNVSLLEHLMNREGPRISRQLRVQYRMHEEIMTFSSDEFYDQTLVADASVREHLLAVPGQASGLEGVQLTELTGSPLHFIDTAGAGYDEQQEVDGDSRRNPREAELIARLTGELLDTGLIPNQLGIITPYGAQVRLLRGMLPHEGLEIDSVDGFQGREKEAILISLVRSNANGEIGFLRDTRRMNVALTRARRKLIVVGDSATLAVDPFYLRLFEYFEAAGAYHSVWEY